MGVLVAQPPQKTGAERGSAWAFIAAAYTYVLIMASTTLPTPMYPIYRQQMHFSVFTITVVFAVYVVGVLIALLVFGRWSDVFGRRPMMVAAVVSALVATALFLIVPSTESLALLMIARLFSGLAAGLFVGAATVAMVELAPTRWAGRASFVATAVNVCGLGVGPIFSGLVIQFVGVQPLRITFYITLGLLLVSAALMLRVPETAPIARGPRHIPRIRGLSVPPASRGPFRRALIPGMTGFAVLGLFGSVAPTLLSAHMGVKSVALQGLGVFVVFLASALMQLSIASAPPVLMVRIGCGLIVVGSVVIAVSALTLSPTALIVGGMIAGAGQGATMAKGVAQVAEVTPEAMRAQVNSTLFLFFYLGLAVPAVAIGAAAIEWPLVSVTGVFAWICAGLGVVALLVNSLGAGAGGALHRHRSHRVTRAA